VNTLDKDRSNTTTRVHYITPMVTSSRQIPLFSQQQINRTLRPEMAKKYVHCQHRTLVATLGSEEWRSTWRRLFHQGRRSPRATNRESQFYTHRSRKSSNNIDTYLLEISNTKDGRRHKLNTTMDQYKSRSDHEKNYGSKTQINRQRPYPYYIYCISRPLKLRT
jgi:hypothetical protein